ncbi:MAG: spondin domain-containing protein, partial [Candidatus Dormibacteria bacterium]
HGFDIEILPTNPPQLLASWFVFAPTSGQAWIGGLGPIDGNQAVVQGYQVAGPGALFPPDFNGAKVQRQLWGTLTFTFTDCNTGQLSWASTVPAYGSGTLNLVRLTMPAGLTCP